MGELAEGMGGMREAGKGREIPGGVLVSAGLGGGEGARGRRGADGAAAGDGLNRKQIGRAHV